MSEYNADSIIKKICLFSDHHICINPRMWKEAFFYAREGFEVVVYSMWTSSDLLERDLKLISGHNIRYCCYLNMIPGKIPGWKRFFFRLRKRLASEMVKRTGLESGLCITYSPDLMYRKVKKESADLYVAHMESALIAARKLMMEGKKVAVDFEDWYSQDYLVPDRPVKLLKKLEKFALGHAFFCTATSEAMARALRLQHRSEREITVIYNGFSINELPTGKVVDDTGNSRKLPRLIWFSRNIGPDRGIETLFAALKKADFPVELHLLGMISLEYKQHLKEIFPKELEHVLVVHEFMDHHKLASFLSSFDIGLALEESEFPSRDVTITNKILQYLQAGIKILATDTSGQKEVADFFTESVRIVERKNADDWIKGLKDLVEWKINRENIRSKYENLFSWEAQESKLKNLINISEKRVVAH